MNNVTAYVTVFMFVVSAIFGFIAGYQYKTKELKRDGLRMEGPGWVIETRPTEKISK